jgi:hypothetical protein
MKYFARKGVFNLWGVSYGPGHKNSIEASFICSLLWAHRKPVEKPRDVRHWEDSSIDMALDLPNSASIPSWSWMSWRGEISFPQPIIIIDTMVHDIQLESGQDSWVKLHDYHSAISTASKRVLPYHITPPKVLLLDVDCVHVSEISLDSIGNLRVWGQETHWYVSRGLLQPKALYELFQLEKLELLVLGHVLLTGKYYLMIVEKLEGFAVRTGICTVHSNRRFRLKLTGQRKCIRLA